MVVALSRAANDALMNASSDLDRRRLHELALRAGYAFDPCFTRFLEPSMEADARTAAREAGVELALWGGHDAAERRIAAFYTDAPPAEADYPLACLELQWNSKYAEPGHRDLLGAVMGLGLERDAVGDIAPGEADGTAYLFVHRDVETYITGNLDSAGRAKLKLRRAEMPPRLKPPEGISLRVTVSSFRLDAVLAAGLKLSRGEAQRLITSGQVKRNHAEILRGDARLEEGDLLSVRGHGRVRVDGFEGLTRKGRQAVRLFRYTG